VPIFINFLKDRLKFYFYKKNSFNTSIKHAILDHHCRVRWS